MLLIAWRVCYWLCFVLTWAILPILLSYSDSGHRSPQKRLLQSLRENARYHLTILSIGSVGLVYFFLTSGFRLYSIKGLLVALSYCYALFLAISLMGHGLVAIPRGLLQASSVSGTLRKLQRNAPRAYDKLIDASGNLEAVESELILLRQRKTGTALEFQEWIDEISEMAQIPAAPRGGAILGSRASVPPIITEEYLAALTRRLKLCIHRKARFSSEWESLVQAAADAQSILDSKSSRRLTFTKHFSSPTLLEKISPLNPYTRHLAYFYILPYIHIAAAALLATASTMIIWTELVHTIFPKLAVIRYTVVHHPSSSSGKIGFAGQCISGLWIAYMCFAAYYSLSAVKVWGNYALVHRGTSASSACFYASYAARLTVPLAYNFLTFLPEEEIVVKSVFYNFLGKLVNLTTISEGFNDFFPALVLVPVCATLFNLYGRVKGVFGFADVVDEDAPEDAFESGGWREGRDLIERELLGATAGVFVRARGGGPSTSYGSASTSSPPRGNLPGPATARGARASRYRDEPDAEEEEAADEGVWGGFVHRVRNTLDTVETPRWLAAQGRPKWMTGN